MLLLTLVVGSGIFTPIANENFYIWCMVVEAFICIAALALSTEASRIIIIMSLMLIGFHYLGLKLGGHQDDSPYHVLVKMCECLELAACILLSRPFLKWFIKDVKNV